MPVLQASQLGSNSLKSNQLKAFLLGPAITQYRSLLRSPPISLPGSKMLNRMSTPEATCLGPKRETEPRALSFRKTAIKCSKASRSKRKNRCWRKRFGSKKRRKRRKSDCKKKGRSRKKRREA
jgi:hypothetical protein